MRKKSLLKIFFMAPFASILLVLIYLFSLQIPNHLSPVFNLREENPPVLNTREADLNTNRISDLESRIKLLQERVAIRVGNDESQIEIDSARGILASTVRIIRENATGSGIAIYHNQVDDIHYTYFITNAHVVENAKEVQVMKYSYLRNASISSTETFTGEVIAKDTDIDLALIEVMTPREIGPTVQFDSLSLNSNLTLYQRVYVSACPLGNPPLITDGHVGFISDTRNVITAFSIFGSSGGGVFNKEGRLVGIVRGISMVPMENVNIPESSLTHVIPGPIVRSWLLAKNLSFIFNDGTHESYVFMREALKNLPFFAPEDKK